MADKKITALTAVADSEIGADDLLHIVDNPGGTPVNKKMTIGQMFENIPTHIAIDDIATLTAAATNLASTFATFIDGSSFSGDVEFVLDNGTDVGQLKVILMSTVPASTHKAQIQVQSWGYSTDTTLQIQMDARGESVLLMWNGTAWFVVASNDATIT